MYINNIPHCTVQHSPLFFRVEREGGNPAWKNEASHFGKFSGKHHSRSQNANKASSNWMGDVILTENIIMHSIIFFIFRSDYLITEFTAVRGSF